MMRSLYAGVAGLRNHQTRMDVIGNNIANVNTTAFKKNRVSFQDMIYQNVRGASAPVAGALGGTNPAQVGLGMTVASIDVINTQGSAQTTGKINDLMIQGDGYFAMTDGTNTYYTRAGNFEFDANGDLVNPANGYHVVSDGGANINVPTNAQSYKIDATGYVTYVDNAGAPQPAVYDADFQIRLSKFPNPAGLEKIGENLYKETPNSANAANPRIDGYAGEPATAFANVKIVPGSLEMSNVDLSQEFTDMIVTQRGFQANSRIITVSDSMLEELVNLKR